MAVGEGMDVPQLPEICVDELDRAYSSDAHVICYRPETLPRS